MVAADSSTLIAYLAGSEGKDVVSFEAALLGGDICLPPVVLAEVLCDPHIPERHASLTRRLPVLAVLDNYWSRAAETRAKLLSRRLQARLADTLIAQSCIDHDVALIARDVDFRHFAKHCGLKLA